MSFSFERHLQLAKAQVGSWAKWKRNCFGELAIPPIDEATNLLKELIKDKEWFISIDNDGSNIIIVSKGEVYEFYREYWDYPVILQVEGEL